MSDHDKGPIDWPVIVGLLLVAIHVGWMLGWWLGARFAP